MADGSQPDNFPLPTRSLAATTAAGIGPRGIIDEVGAGAKRILPLLIDLDRWVNSSPEQHAEQLADPAFLPPAPDLHLPDLELPVRELRSGLNQQGTLDGDRGIASGLLGIVDWAEGLQAISTAFELAKASLRVCPGSAMINYRVGRLARRIASYVEAEEWLNAAIRLGRESGDWRAHALGYAGLGNLYRDRGSNRDLQRAERNHVLALRAARTHFLPEIEGDALHDLAVISFEKGNARAGLIYARDALDRYGSDHPRIPTLASDVAWNWMHLLHAYDSAFEIFNEVSAHVTEPKERLYVIANIARSAAGSGKSVQFQRASSEIYRLVETVPVSDEVASAMLQLAYAAMDLARGTDAKHTAEYALRVADERGNAVVRNDAMDLLNRLSEDPVVWSTGSGLALSQSDPQQRATQRLATELLNVLRKRTPSQPRWTDAPKFVG